MKKFSLIFLFYAFIKFPKKLKIMSHVFLNNAILIFSRIRLYLHKSTYMYFPIFFVNEFQKKTKKDMLSVFDLCFGLILE